MSIEVAAKIMGILAHTEGRTCPTIYLCLGDLVVTQEIKDLAREYLYPMKDQGVLTWNHGVWSLTVEGYTRLNLMRKPVTPEPSLTPVSPERFVPSDHYQGEDLWPIVGRAGAFDYRDKASRIGNEFVPYMIAKSLNSPVRKVFNE
jgi:hypothetical protein